MNPSIELTKAAKAAVLADALQVLVFTPHIKRYLKANDPMALRQAKAALRNIGIKLTLPKKLSGSLDK